MKEVTIYTDGACSGNPGPGGWGAVLFHGDKRKEISGAEPHSTNNRMEIQAVIEALSLLKVPCRVTVYSDSAYVVNCFQNNWLKGWLRNGWKNSKGNPVENKELWQRLWELMGIHEVTYVKVKGHSDNPWNNRCDELAVGAIKQMRAAGRD